MKKALKKLIVVAVIIAILLFAYHLVFGSKTAKIGDTIKAGIAEITVTDIMVSDAKYLEGNKSSDEFLFPKEELELNDKFISSTNENESPIVITLIAKNVGKNDLDIYPFDFVVNYADGYEYYSKKCYVKTVSSGWSEFEKVALEKLTSGAVEIRIAVWVPDDVMKDTGASLELEFHNYTYKIR